MVQREIKFSPPDISQSEINEVTDTLLSGWITTGPKTKRLETKMADYIGSSRFVCLNSATAAMELTLRLLGIGPGDQVITSAYTYSASAAVICHVGAEPVIVDTAPGSFEICPRALEKALTERTKAVIPVDIGGVICDYDRIYAALEANKLSFNPKNDIQRSFGRPIVVADAAHSFGSVRDGVASGLHADFSCFSFHAIKNLAMGEGGGVTWKKAASCTSDEEIYHMYMLLSLHGQTKDALSKTKLGSWEYDIKFPGYKCNLTDIMASIGLAQLERYPELLARREEIARLYEEIFINENIWTLKHIGDEFRSNCHLYITRLPGREEEFRNHIIKKLAEKGVPSNVHFQPLPMLTAYKNLGYNINNFPNAYNMYKNAISLPLHTLLSDDDVKYIGEALLDCLAVS